MANKIPFELSDYVLKKYFLETGKRQGWLDLNKISLAVSGGGDSIAMLWLFRNFFDGEITAIHVNHGIRGSESDDDERFTAEFAENLGVKFRAVRVSVPEARAKGESLETSARRLRLSSLIKTSKELAVNSIMLGHNRDDLAETVLFNILRGTGIRGSVGMTESTESEGVKFFRPLLGLRRGFLRDVLRARGLAWREDSSNDDDSYTRNFIRLRLLPLIASNVNASAVEHLAQFGEEMRSVRENEDARSEALVSECECDDGILDRKKLRALGESDIMLVIREIGRRLGLRTLSRRRCAELSGLILADKNFTFQWCADMTVSARNGRIFFKGGRKQWN